MRRAPPATVSHHPHTPQDDTLRQHSSGQEGTVQVPSARFLRPLALSLSRT